MSYNNFFVFPLAAGIIVLRRGRAEPKLASPHFDEDAYQVEMEPASPVVNTVLTGVGKLEVALLRRMICRGAPRSSPSPKSSSAAAFTNPVSRAAPDHPPCGCRARAPAPGRRCHQVWVVPCSVLSPPQ